MSTEQKLIDALTGAHAYEPSPDLLQRVVHSIEEDGRHRRRVRLTAATVAITLLAAIGLAAANVQSASEGAAGQRIDWRIIEVLEFGLLVALIVALGPVIRRFGRGFAGDLFQQHGQTGVYLLRLLDVAYYLVFVGYTLMTTRLAEPGASAAFRIGDQIEEAAVRIGGMLATMGLLHALALVALPLVAFVFNTTQAGKQLPRWVVVILIVAAFLIGSNLPGLLVFIGERG